MKHILFGGIGRKWIAWMMSFIFSATMILVPAGQSRALTLSEEKELGRKVLEQIRRMMPLVEDGEIVGYVESLGNRITKQFGTTSYQWQFFVVDQSVPNAFAIPGGYVFIYRGLIDLLTSEGELAGVMAHELAHIQLHHIERRMNESKLWNIASLAGLLAGVLLGMGGGGAAGGALAMGGSAGAAAFQLQYSRENEEEADQRGFRYFCELGYPPQDMPNAMKRLSQGNWVSEATYPSYLSTHPLLTERVQYLEELVRRQRAQSPKAVYGDNMGDFPIMKAALTAQYGNTGEIADRFQAEARKGDPVALYGLGRFYLRKGDVQQALPCLEQAARQKAGSPFILSSLGAVYFQQGRLQDALKMLEGALSMDSAAPMVHYRIALVLKDMGKKEEALEHLQRIEGLAPTFPEVDYQLGVLMGETNRLGKAHFHLGRYYEVKGDLKLAIFHYEKARAMLRGTPQGEDLDEKLKTLEKKKKEAGYQKSRGK